MHLFRLNLNPIKTAGTKRPAPCVVTIGNFDGLHLGHQSLIQQLKTIANRENLASTVILFEPQPLEFFKPENPPARLMNFRAKLEQMQALGVKQVVCIRFNAAFGQLSAMAFIKTLLVEYCQAKHILIGDDFHFGHQRQGNFKMLSDQACELGYALTQSVPCTFLGQRVSSSWLREVLQHSDFNLAAKLLNRPYAWSGKIVYGAKLGSSLGFATANILPKRQALPFCGVFAVEFLFEGEQNDPVEQQTYCGIANLGWRPTVDGKKALLEVHLLDFNHNLYGKRATVIFRHKFRDEQKFNSVSALKQQIGLDVACARIFFN